MDLLNPTTRPKMMRVRPPSRTKPSHYSLPRSTPTDFAMSLGGANGTSGAKRIGIEDDTLSAFDDARKICRTASAECNRDSLKKAIASAKTVAAVLSLARADRRLAATVDQWDS